MEYQRFVPEGWNNVKENFNLEQLQNAKSQGMIIQGFVNKCDNNSNLEIQFGENIIGIIPKNEFDAINKDDYGITKPNICQNKVNQFIQFKIKDIYDENRLLLSRKDAQEHILNCIKNEFKPGMIVDGIVKNIRQFGAFVDIGGGIIGLLHIEDISISRIKSPEERFSIGQKIKVMIKSIDEQKNKIVLSYKELLGNWEDNIKDFQEKMIVDRYYKRS